MPSAVSGHSRLHHRMLARYYIEALLNDEALADEVWHLWYSGAIDDNLAALLWLLTAATAGRYTCGKSG
ncbi:MAG: hypothetical protein WD672_04085 [Woeseia sp.]